MTMRITVNNASSRQNIGAQYPASVSATEIILPMHSTARRRLLTIDGRTRRQISAVSPARYTSPVMICGPKRPKPMCRTVTAERILSPCTRRPSSLFNDFMASSYGASKTTLFFKAVPLSITKLHDRRERHNIRAVHITSGTLYR